MIEPDLFPEGHSVFLFHIPLSFPPDDGKADLSCRCLAFLFCMDREQIKGFYYTDAWKECREAYKQSVGGLCEVCRAKGLIVAGEIVHHKIHLNASNINDPSITLNFDNLQLVCRKCHGDIHRTRIKRYQIAEDGAVIVR